MTAENVAQRDPRLAELSERYRIARSVIGDLVVEKTAATDAVDSLQQTIAQLVEERDQHKARADELEGFIRAAGLEVHAPAAKINDLVANKITEGELVATVDVAEPSTNGKPSTKSKGAK